MREVSDSFLLNMAEVSATLIGLFLIGVFFYLDSGRRHARPVRTQFEAYLRTGTRITLIVFAILVFLPMTLVVLDPVWALGGFHPSREDLTWAILLAFAAGFTSISATVVSAFDVDRPAVEPADGDRDAGALAFN